jgi:YidC/Oxa1 family membrane protein insertase
MDRNTVVGLVLIGAILIGYSVFTKPSAEEMAEAKRKRDSIEVARINEEARKALTKELELGSTPDVSVASEDDSLQIATRVGQFGAFASNLSGKEEFYTLENADIKLVISAKGGRPYSVTLKDYKTHDSLPLVLFDGDSSLLSLDFFAQNRNISTSELYFSPLDVAKPIVTDKDSQVLTLRLMAGENASIDYVYKLAPSGFMVDFDIRLSGMDEYIPKNVNRLNLSWEIFTRRQEKGIENERMSTTTLFRHFQDDVDNMSERSKKLETEDVPTRLQWFAFKQQFFSSVLISKNSFQRAQFTQEPLTSERYLKRMSANAELSYESKAEEVIPMAFYFGPNNYKTLKKYDMELEKLVTLGGNIIGWINRFVIIPIFNWLNQFIQNYGIIILLLTIIIKIGLLPLTYKSYMSQAKMRVLKPQIDEINERIPKEKALERQQASMALYKKAGVNPMGGCLPMLLQMPILFAMFRFFPNSIELRQEKFLWADDLSTYDSILDLPFTIPFYGDHVSLFTILMTLSTVLTMKLSNQMTSTNQMPGMKTMMYMMPVMFMFILNSFSAGLTYYYFLANMITFGQNELFRRLVDDDKILKKIQANKTKPVKKSKFQARLEEMAKQQGKRPTRK